MTEENQVGRGSGATQLAAFLLGTFVPVSLACRIAASSGGLAAHPGLVPLCMLTPMLSAVAVQAAARLPIRGARGLGFAWGRLRWWLLGPLAFAGYVAASLLISVLASPTLAASASEVAANTGHLNTPHGLGVPVQLCIALAATLLVGPVLNLPLFLGEEVGWRGFMNPRLVSLLGTPGLLVGGAIWALWHLPFILLGHNYPAHPWLGLGVWIPSCVCMNVLLELVRRRSGTIIACALSHGAMNQLATLLMGVFIDQRAFIDLVDGPAGAIGLGVLLLPAVAAYRSLDASYATSAATARGAAAAATSGSGGPAGRRSALAPGGTA